MINFKQFFFEKNVVGVIETIFIEGLGDIAAKIDSGNSAYNVLHGTNIDISNNNITFTTVKNKIVTKPIVGSVTINVGAGHTEERPVVEFNVKILDKEFSNVKFSISDRSTNDNPVLIGKNFIINQLDALIDVASTNLLSKKISVTY